LEGTFFVSRRWGDLGKRKGKGLVGEKKSRVKKTDKGLGGIKKREHSKQKKKKRALLGDSMGEKVKKGKKRGQHLFGKGLKKKNHKGGKRVTVRFHRREGGRTVTKGRWMRG